MIAVKFDYLYMGQIKVNICMKELTIHLKPHLENPKSVDK